jgi:Mor family transcriptional regulator
MKSRISVLKEDQIWELRCQGMRYELIANIVNCSPVSMTKVIRRVRQRPPLKEDPIKRGRYRGFLSDAQVNDIRARAKYNESIGFIARAYDMTPAAIYAIVTYRSYKEPCQDDVYIPNFKNRLMR